MTSQPMAKIVLSIALGLFFWGAWPLSGQAQSQSQPASPTEFSIAITEVPVAGGGSGRMERIAGRVQGPDVTRYRVVLYACTDTCYVQPYVASPFTSINADGSWGTRIHLGQEYAALLVAPSYQPPATTFALPPRSANVLAVIRVAAQ